MANDELRNVALPKLYGAPAYARPPRPVEPDPRPLDRDDLPLDAYQTPDERSLARSLPARPYRGSAPADPIPSETTEPSLRPRPFRLRAIAERIIGPARVAAQPDEAAGPGPQPDSAAVAGPGSRVAAQPGEGAGPGPQPDPGPGAKRPTRRGSSSIG